MKNVIIAAIFMAIIMAGICHSGEAITIDEQPSKSGNIYQFLNPTPGGAEGSKSDCYLVGIEDSARVAEYDVQRSTGNMLAVLVRAGDGRNSNVTVYFSNDGGQNWTRKFQYSTNDYVPDADCAIYGDYCLVAFTTSAISGNYLHARRFHMSDGSLAEFPSGQTNLTIWSSATAMKEIVVISTQDINTPKYYTYFIATLEAMGYIQVLMADEGAEDWFSHSAPNISNARCGLDMCLNEYNGDYASPYSKFISSYDDNNYLRIFGYMEGSEFWDDVANASVAADVPDFTAIDAYNNNVHCIFENYSGGEEYCRIYSSFNGGSDWSLYIFESDHEHHCPDLTARAGSGLGVAYRIHWSSPPYYIITSRFKHGDYDYDPWYGPETVLSSPGDNVQPDLEFLPSGYYGYLGIVWSGTTPGQAYFCTMGYCCQVAGDANNDGNCNIGDAVYLVNYVFNAAACATNYPIGCPPVCPPQGDANADGNVNIGDAVFINNFVFRPAVSPEPTCP
jgi:hypothetical protein